MRFVATSAVCCFLSGCSSKDKSTTTALVNVELKARTTHAEMQAGAVALIESWKYSPEDIESVLLLENVLYTSSDLVSDSRAELTKLGDKQASAIIARALRFEDVMAWRSLLHTVYKIEDSANLAARLKMVVQSIDDDFLTASRIVRAPYDDATDQASADKTHTEAFKQVQAMNEILSTTGADIAEFVLHASVATPKADFVEKLLALRPLTSCTENVHLWVDGARDVPMYSQSVALPVLSNHVRYQLFSNGAVCKALLELDPVEDSSSSVSIKWDGVSGADILACRNNYNVSDQIMALYVETIASAYEAAYQKSSTNSTTTTSV